MEDSDSKEDQLPHCSPGVDRQIFWKKRCLYAVLVVLVTMVTVNLTLVCWLVAVLDLDTHGMSYMQSFGGGIQLTAKTFVHDLLVTQGFKTREGLPMALRSVDNLTLRTTDRVSQPTSAIYLGRDTLDISSPNFTVTDGRGRTLFSVDEDSVSLATHSLAISGEGGSVLEGSLLTPVVSADVRSDLVLESAKKGVQVVTPAGISIESRAGDIQVSGHQDVTLQTVDGSIKLESANVLLRGLRKLHLHKHIHRGDKIYQLCVCDNGQLFLGEADASCDADGASLEFCE